MTRGARLPLLLLAAMAGCDIDFVAVEESEYGTVTLASSQVSALEADIEFWLPRQGPAPPVLVDGTTLAAERDGDHWRFASPVAVDTLQPTLGFTIGGPDGLSLTLPLLVRNGAAQWRSDGSLLLPIVYSGDPAEPSLSWHLRLIDAEGRGPVSVLSHGTPLPSPLVLSADLAAPGAVAAEIAATFHREIVDGSFPLTVGISSSVRVPIPADPR